MLILTLRFVHILFAATWFGSTLFVAGDVRRTLVRGAPHIQPLFERMRRTTRVAAASGWLVLLTGVGLIFALGGFGSVSIGIHIALALVLVMIVAGAMMGQTWGEIAKQVERGETPEARYTKRLAALSGVFQLLWTVSLALMVFRNLLPHPG